jgi:hypothetical protein
MFNRFSAAIACFVVCASGCVGMFEKLSDATLASYLSKSTSSDSTCSSGAGRAFFLANVDPVLEAKCTGCHSALAYRLGMGASASNYTASLSEGQKVADYGSGGAGHPGGAVLGAADVTLISSWLSTESQVCSAPIVANAACTVGGRAPAAVAAPVGSPSNLARSSGAAIFLRLTSLFPLQNIPAVNFDLYAAQGLNKSVAMPERFTSPTAQISFVAQIEPLCLAAATNPSMVASALLADFKLAGEVLPVAAAARDTLMIARNTWLYPYSATSLEVVELLNAYNGAYNASIAAGSSVAQSTQIARTTACVAALQAPQFWLGNAGPLDVLRKVALEVGKTVPVDTDFSGFQSAANPSAWMRTYVANLQTQPAYLQSVKYWHQDYLGLEPLNWGFTYDPRGYPTIFGASATMGSSSILNVIKAPGTNVDGLWRVVPLENTLGFIYTDSEQCTSFDQPFDPRTTEILWEQMNPAVGGAWETIGSQQFQNGAWVDVPGSITLANGTKRATNVADVNFGQTNGAGYHYIRGNLVGTPLEFFAKGSRRVRRFSPSGEQNGFSHVKLPFSGQDAVVCNTLMRFVASCAYRPTIPNMLHTSSTVYDESNRGGSNTASWNGDGIANFLADKVTYGTRYAMPISNQGAVYLDSFANGNLLDQMHCGNPNPAEAAKNGLAGYNEALAYPPGYALATDPNVPPQNGLISAAINITWGLPLSPASPEAQAIAQVKSDLGQDASRLISSVIGTNQDYRQILLANHTYGSEYTRQYLATQALYLPTAPVGLTLGASPGTVSPFDGSGFGTLNQRWTRNNLGNTSLPISWTNYFASVGMNINGDLIPPKPMQGILSTVEFMGPVSTGVRTAASRIITRLTCGGINSFVPAGGQVALHKTYVTQATHLQTTCIQCHINLDPLASALNVNFAADPTMLNAGIKKYAAETDNSLFNGFFGIRAMDNPGTGAFLGQPATGLAGVAAVLANSNEFATCAVQKAFENIFGRALSSQAVCAANPTNTDCLLVTQTAQKFMQTYNYNQMVQDLVASPLNLQGN